MFFYFKCFFCVDILCTNANMMMLPGWFGGKYKVHVKVTVTVVTLDKCHRLYSVRSTSPHVKSVS